MSSGAPSGGAIASVSETDGIDLTANAQGGTAHVESEHRDRGHGGVKVNGRITSIAASTRTLQVGTSQVDVAATAIIRHGDRTLAFSDLKVGDHIEAKGTMNGTGTVLTATEVKVESGGEGDHGKGDHGESDHGHGGAELEGAVSAVAGTCPAKTFTVQATKVTMNASTTFRGGLTCETVANSVIVEVKGTRQTDGSIVAARVARDDKDEDEADDDKDKNERELEGAVSAVGGSCPAKNFTVESTKVTLTASTVFRGGLTCEAIANGTIVEVKGTRQTDGSIVALRIARED
jgi:hypothetical protein